MPNARFSSLNGFLVYETFPKIVDHIYTKLYIICFIMRKTRNSINTTIWSNLLYLYSMFTRELGRQEMGDEIEVFFFLVSVIIN